MQDSGFRYTCGPCDKNQWYYLSATQGIGIRLCVMYEKKIKILFWFIYNSAFVSCSLHFFQNVVFYKDFAVTIVILRVFL